MMNKSSYSEEVLFFDKIIDKYDINYLWEQHRFVVNLYKLGYISDKEFDKYMLSEKPIRPELKVERIKNENNG